MTDRSALVTGGSRGIGLATARELAAAGYALSIIARDPERLRRAAAELGRTAVEVAALPVDLSEDEGPARAVATHQERFGGLDVLVCNAGTGTAGPLADYALDRFDRTMDVNVRASFSLIQSALPLLRKAGKEHRNAWVFIVSSITGKAPAAGLGAYGASKATMIALAHSLNLELAEEGVRTSALCPAYVDTDMAAWVHDRVPPETMVASDDVARSVRFLLQLSPTTLVPELVLGRVGAGHLQP